MATAKQSAKEAEVNPSPLPQGTEPVMQPGLQQPPPQIQHIWVSANISKKLEDTVIQFILLQAQQSQRIEEYVLYFNTPGGYPFSAIAMYNFIKSIPQKTTIYNMGMVASAGVPFFLGFQNRIGVPDCSFMIHQTSMASSSFSPQVNVFDLKTQMDQLAAIDESSQKIILKETTGKAKQSLTAKEISDACLQSTSYNAEQALTYGFIDRIELPQLPESGVLYITDQVLATMPGV